MNHGEWWKFLFGCATEPSIICQWNFAIISHESLNSPKYDCLPCLFTWYLSTYTHLTVKGTKVVFCLMTTNKSKECCDENKGKLLLTCSMPFFSSNLEKMSFLWCYNNYVGIVGLQISLRPSAKRGMEIGLSYCMVYHAVQILLDVIS